VAATDAVRSTQRTLYSYRLGKPNDASYGSVRECPWITTAINESGTRIPAWSGSKIKCVVLRNAGSIMKSRNSIENPSHLLRVARRAYKERCEVATSKDKGGPGVNFDRIQSRRGQRQVYAQRSLPGL
jgi:hypothetical protein